MGVGVCDLRMLGPEDGIYILSGMHPLSTYPCLLTPYLVPHFSPALHRLTGSLLVTHYCTYLCGWGWVSDTPYRIRPVSTGSPLAG